MDHSLPSLPALPLIIISILKYFKLPREGGGGPTVLFLVYLAPACSLRMQSQIAALNEININFYELFPVNEKQDASCDGHEEETFSLAIAVMTVSFLFMLNLSKQNTEREREEERERLE